MSEIDNEAILRRIINRLELMGNEKDNFQKMIDCMYDNGEPVYTFNRFPWQSRQIIKKLFDIAIQDKQPLYMFVGDPKCEFYDEGDFFEALEEVANNTIAEIVLAEKPTDDLIARWEKLNSLKSVQVFFKPEYDVNAHHVSMAGHGYRYEFPHPKASDREKVTEIYPERPAQFGFHNHNIISGLMFYWRNRVRSDCSRLIAATN